MTRKAARRSALCLTVSACCFLCAGALYLLGTDDSEGSNAVAISRSTDGGRSWNQSLVARPPPGCRFGTGVCAVPGHRSSKAGPGRWGLHRQPSHWGSGICPAPALLLAWGWLAGSGCMLSTARCRSSGQRTIAAKLACALLSALLLPALQVPCRYCCREGFCTAAWSTGEACMAGLCVRLMMHA